MHTEHEITEAEREQMRASMLGVIFPNTPYTAFEKAAFERAVDFQILHNKTHSDNEMPAGARSVRIGHYTIEMQENWNGGDSLTRQTLCSAAYGILLTAGLLYKGVERV
ncbi:MAG: hypothetical protein IJ242_11105 [Clostridia bacterium]|nr:hypothetical protein [Clostridia bacterium]